MSSVGDAPLLRVSTARLANAMVAVLGARFSLGSVEYQRIKCLVADSRGGLQQEEGPGGGGGGAGGLAAGEAMWAALEQVRRGAAPCRLDAMPGTIRMQLPLSHHDHRADAFACAFNCLQRNVTICN